MGSCFDTSYEAYDITLLPEHEEFYAMEEEKECIIEQMKDAIRKGSSHDGL